MAAYNCTLFLNTGFNTINIPDSPALVNGMSSISVPALDINQERFLPYVRVRATWDQVKNADYCKVGDFYYTINSINMTSQDVAEISLTPDFITSAGGPAAMEILDGITNRVHVSNDTFGIYSADDPYMAPAYDMDVVTSMHQFSQNNKTFVETTINLFNLGSKLNAGTLEAFTAKDKYAEDQGEEEVPQVTVPIVNYLQSSTSYSCNFFGSSFTLQNVQNQGVYELRDGWDVVPKGINVARSLGIEQSISGQYAIPEDLVTPSHAGSDPFLCSSMAGAGGDISGWSADLSFIYGTAQNNRVWYGSQSPYTLISATGESISANAEACYSAGATAPVVRYWADPRRTGKPYFRFATLNGNSNRFDLFRGSISGRQWNSIPMVLTEKSGNALDRVNYNASVARRDLADVYEEVGYDVGKVANIANMAGQSLGGMLTGGPGKAITGGLSGMAGAAALEMQHMQYQDTSALERQLEKEQFQIQQAYNVPTIMFPNDPSLMAEFLRNGCLLCRTVYKAQDIARIDKILTAFGYKYVKVLETSDFTNRQKFNYVEGSITVGGNLPRWWCNGISAQIAGGVRVWHIKPTHTAYSSNPIV